MNLSAYYEQALREIRDVEDNIARSLTTITKDYVIEKDDDINIIDFIKRPSYKIEIHDAITIEHFRFTEDMIDKNYAEMQVLLFRLYVLVAPHLR